MVNTLNEFRPQNFSEFFGQMNIKEELKIYIHSAKKHNRPLSHILLSGPSGMGKTSLSYVISNEMNTNIKTINAPMIETNNELIEILAQIKEGEILFIDEIHRLDKKIEEVLYSVLEDFTLNISYKSEEKSKIVAVKIPHFTLIGATTLEGMISIPLRERFPLKFHFKNYNKDELVSLLFHNSEKMGITFEDQKSAEYFIDRTKNNPRILNNLLLKLRDFASFNSKNAANINFLFDFFKFAHIDDYGLDDFDKSIIKVLYENFPSQPVSLQSIASLIGENTANIKDNCEPYLVNIGMIRRTRSGRILTDKGKLFYWNNIKPFEK